MIWKSRLGTNIYKCLLNESVMETTITSSLDREIEKYRSQHGGANPLYCIMSAEEADEIADAQRRADGDNSDVIVTTYRVIKIVRNGLMERGKYFLSNELPETGS